MSLTSALLLLAVVCLIALPFAVPGLLEVLLALTIAALLNAMLVWMGVLPEQTDIILLALAFTTVVSAVVIWKPLRRLQKGDEKLQEDSRISDFVGTVLYLNAPLNKTEVGQIDFSGLSWQVRLSPEATIDQLPAGAAVKVVSAGVGLLVVTNL